MWPNEEESDDALMKQSKHILYHYSTDADIRAKDEAYGIRQRQVIEEILTSLKHSIE